MIKNPFYPQRKRITRYSCIIAFLVLLTLGLMLMASNDDEILMKIKFMTLFILNSICLFGSVVMMVLILYLLQN